MKSKSKMAKILVWTVVPVVLAMLLLHSGQTQSVSDSNTLVNDQTIAGVCAQRPSDMVAWWPLDQLNPDGEYDDLAGGDNNGTPIGNPSQIPNKFVGNSLQAGIGKFVAVTDAPNLNFGMESFTIDAWVKFTPDSQTDSIVYKLASPSGSGYFLSIVKANQTQWKLQLEIANQPYAGPIINATQGTWIFVAATVDKTSFNTGTVNLYVGVPGSLLKFETHTAGAFNASSQGTPLLIGRWSGNPHANLGIDEVEIFSRALSQQPEIESLFAAGSVGKCKPDCLPPAPLGMVAWWPLDETEGSQVVLDLAGGHEGTPMNFGGAVTTIGAAGGPEPVTGFYVGNSLRFEGAYVEVPDSPDLNFGTGGKDPFTIDAWVNYYPLQQSRPIVSKLASFNGPGYFLSIEPGAGAVFNLTLQINGTKYIGPEVPPSRWVFVAATRDANGVKLYVGYNNTLIRISRLGSPVNASSEGTPLWIGQQQGPGNVHPTAEIDEVEIFNRALDELEVEGLFRADWAGKCKQQCVPPLSGMVSWWSGDSHPNDILEGYFGELVGGVSYSPGRVDQAFSFPSLGSTGSDRVGLHSGPSANTFTIDAWVFANRHGPSAYRTIYADDNRGFWLKGGTLNWWQGVDRFVGTTVVPLGAWHHIALTYSAGTFTGYVDGEAEVGTSSFLDAFLPTGPGLGIGGHSGFVSEDFDGLIDEVEIFNRALTQSEIKSIYNAGSAGKCKPTPGTGTVIIRKNTVGGDATFGYTTGGAGLSAFNLTTSGGTGSQTFSNIAPGPKTVTETPPPLGWVFTSLVCSDPDGGTTVSEQTANIDLDADEILICTYTNTKCPAISINPASGALRPTGVNALYTQTFTATGGCSSFNYSVTSGALPNGLMLGANGVLTGTPTKSGTYDFTVTATDSCGCGQSQTYTLTVCPTWPLRLFNTGVAGNGSPLASGATDPHYVLLNTSPVFPNALVLPKIAGYLANSATSQWLGPDLPISLGSQEGFYTYQTTFDLANCDPSTAVISGQWATDNEAEIFLNGSPTAITTGPNDFGAFRRFVITIGFSPGVNTLDFRVRNRLSSSGLRTYTGLRVEMSGSVKCCLETRSLTVTKTITAPSFQRPPSTVVFPTTVACLPFGPDVNLNLSAGTPTQTVNNIPVGSTCTVTEGPLPAPFESQTTIDEVCKWSTPTYSPGQSVTISSSGTPQTVTIQNRLVCGRPPVDTYSFTQGMNEFCIWGGGGGSYNSQTQIDSPLFGVPVRSNNRVRFGSIGLCYGRILSANDRFAFKYTFNAIPVAVLSYPDVNRDFGIPVPGSETRRNIFGAGLSPIGFQLYFRPQSRIKPFVNTSGGFIFFKDPVPQLNGSRFNFTYDFGGGVQVFRDSRRAFNFGYKYQRISNGGRALNNPGFNAHIFYFGYSIFSAPKIAQTDDVEVKRKD